MLVIRGGGVGLEWMGVGAVPWGGVTPLHTLPARLLHSWHVGLDEEDEDEE